MRERGFRRSRRATPPRPRQKAGLTMTTKLFIYNEALGHLGERQLASLNEPREPKRVLDSYWSDVVGFCLSQGLWKFAKRIILIDNSSSLTQQFGYTYSFSIP